MALDLNDTIVALSSAPGPAARAVVRLSGPDALRLVLGRFTTAARVGAYERRLYGGHVALSGVAAPVPADLYAWPAPRSFTGQAVAELHVPGSPPVVERLIADLLAAGARAARPGEFTLRAFLAGKLDLTRAEAVLDVIGAGSRSELQEALGRLAGGVARPLHELRSDLLDLLADLEAGLDFSDEDISFVGREDLLLRLGRALAHLAHLGRQLEGRARTGRPFRVVLAGAPNAGKSSLFNALAGGAALVSPQPGTTRDYLVRRVQERGVAFELVDTAGWQAAPGPIAGQAQELGREQAGEADLVLLCAEGGVVAGDEAASLTGGRPAVRVATKCDLTPAAPGWHATSAVSGQGLAELKALVAERAREWARPAAAPSLSRCRHHVEACTRHLRQAHTLVLEELPAELVALELRTALDELGEMVGAVYTPDLLDRIFSRFCIGK